MPKGLFWLKAQTPPPNSAAPLGCGLVHWSPKIMSTVPCIRLRFFLRSQPESSEVGCATGVGPRSSRATKKVSRLEVWIEKVLSIVEGKNKREAKETKIQIRTGLSIALFVCWWNSKAKNNAISHERAQSEHMHTHTHTHTHTTRASQSGDQTSLPLFNHMRMHRNEGLRACLFSPTFGGAHPEHPSNDIRTCQCVERHERRK